MKRRVGCWVGWVGVLVGCGSVVDLGTKQRVYGGVRLDVNSFVAQVRDGGYERKQEGYGQMFTLPTILFDVPFSLIVDTVVFPFTLTLWAVRDAEPEPSERYTREDVFREAGLDPDAHSDPEPEGVSEDGPEPESSPETHDK